MNPYEETNASEIDRDGDHLRYLLTAYIFETLSDEGRREVEGHLAECADCRAELYSLRTTQSLLEDALKSEPGEYSFEERHRERILAAAWASRGRRYILGVPMKMAAAAALLVMGALGFVVVSWVGESESRDTGGVDRIVAYGASDRHSSEEFDGRRALAERRRGVYGADSASTGRDSHELPTTTAAVAIRAGEDGIDNSADILLKREFDSSSRGLEPTPASPHLNQDLAGSQWTQEKQGGAKDAKLDDELKLGLVGETRSRYGNAQILGGRVVGQDEPLSRVGDESTATVASPPAQVTLSSRPDSGPGGGGGGGGALGMRVGDLDGDGDGTDDIVIVIARRDPQPAPTNDVVKLLGDSRPETQKTKAKKNRKAGRGPVRRESEEPDATTAKDASGLAEVQNQLARGQSSLGLRPELNADTDADHPSRSSETDKEEQRMARQQTPPAPNKKPAETAKNGVYFRFEERENEESAAPVAESPPGDRDRLGVSNLNGKFLGRQKDDVAAGVINEDSYKHSVDIPKGSGLTNPTNAELVDKLSFQDARKFENGRGRPRSNDLGSTHTVNGVSGATGWSYSAKAQAAGAASPEALFRSFLTYRANDPTLTLDRFAKRALPVPPPGIGDEGLGETEFRRLYGTNPFVDTQRDPQSTFSLDVDTASWTLAKNAVEAGRLPSKKVVRVEEFINAFQQDYRADPVEAFSVFCDGMPSVFGGSDVELLRVGIKARDLTPDERRNAVLTVAVDVSGSMGRGERLRLVARTLELLVSSLAPTDRIAIVAYSGEARLVLPHTLVRNRERILGALRSLAPEGGTNVEAGLDLAYRIADEALSPGSLHRVMVISDGVANIGSRNADELLKRIDVYKQRGIYLSVIGIGDRVRDALLEKISNAGNGRYDFIRSASPQVALADAQRIFQENLPGALEVLAEDAKLQVEFNPETVSHYRLLGYENRDIRDEDFRNDKIDAAEVGPGTTVTVLYEIVRRPASKGTLGTVALRFRDAATRQIVERDYPIPPGVLSADVRSAPLSLRHLAGVAETAEILRDSYYARDGSFDAVGRYLASFPERRHPHVQELGGVVAQAHALSVQVLQQKISALEKQVQEKAK